MAKADAVKEFKESQAYIDSCAKYYSVGFEDCLKQVKSNYTYLDLAKVSMDDPLLSTPAGNAVPKETNYSNESEQDTQNDSLVLAQLAANPPVVSLTSSANPPDLDEPSTRDSPDLPPKGYEALQDPSAS